MKRNLFISVFFIFFSINVYAQWIELRNDIWVPSQNYPFEIDTNNYLLWVIVNPSKSQYISQDFGLTWIENDINKDNIDKYVGDSSNFFRIGHSYYIKKYGSRDWERIYGPYLGFPRPSLFTTDLVLTDTTVVAATNQGIWTTGYSNEFLRYAAQSTGYYQSLVNFQCYTLSINGNELFVGTDKGIYKSIDYGKNWFFVGLSEYSIRKIVRKGNDIIVVSNNYFFYSRDGGVSWSEINLELNNIKYLALCGDFLFALTSESNIYFDGILWKKPFEEVITSINIEERIPYSFNLEQNYPNPFNPSTTINYQLPVSGNVSLKVYDLLGREIATLVDEEKFPGYYQAIFDGSNLASGVYLYRLQSGAFSITKKFLLMK